MKVQIRIVNEKGVTLLEHEDDAMKPTQRKLIQEKPLEEGDYKFFGFTYQPFVQLVTKAGGY
jgi:hypothetical protein